MVNRRKSEAGFRTLETRERADVFPTVKDAHDAIDKLPQAFGEAGLIFAVEMVGRFRR